MVSIFSTKFKTNNIYICTRKYVEKKKDPHFGEYTEDTYKKSILAFDGVELLYMIDCMENQNYSYNFSELCGLIQNSDENF
jgi:hypothetical protein